MPNTPKPGHEKRRKEHRFPSPMIPLYDADRGGKNTEKLIGYYNRRTHDIYTAAGSLSRPNHPDGKVNKAHSARWAAVTAKGFRSSGGSDGKPNRRDIRAFIHSLRKPNNWVRHEPPPGEAQLEILKIDEPTSL